MTKMKTSLLAAAAIGALSLGYSTDANASAYGLTADLISQLTFSAASTVGGGLIGFGSFNFNASTGASLNPGASASDVDSSSTPFSVDRGVGGGTGSGASGSVDPLLSQVGTSANAENSFTVNGQAGADYAQGDHHLSDTLINAAGLGACVGATCGGDFESIAEAFVDQNGTGVQQGNSSAGNQQTWDLAFDVPTGGADVTIEFNLDLTQLVELVDENTPAQSTSTFGLNFSVSGEGGDTFLALFNQSIAASLADTSNSADEHSLTPTGIGTGLVTITPSVNGDGTRHFVVTFHVEAGSHSLVINYQAAAGAVSVGVPEPATLGLLGAGLLGLGAMVRRRKTAA